MNQKLTIGRIVHVYVDPRSNNGAEICPAILTRVWGEFLGEQTPVCSVNMRLLLDHSSNDPATNEWRTSAQVFATQEHADLFLSSAAAQTHGDGADQDSLDKRAEWIRTRKVSGMVAFMPPRV